MADATRSYYQAALVALRFVEARRPTGRRFGEDADALWKGFAGELSTSDRLDLLIRDADAEWPGAFGARTVFARPGVAEDEPFGVGWASLAPRDAEELWRAAARTAPPANVRLAFSAMAAAWELALAAFDIGEVRPTDRVVLVGPGAVTAVAERFANSRELGWAEQVIVVATPESHRQLGTTAAALVNVNKATQLLSAIEAEAQKATPRRLLVSGDADANDKAVVAQVFGEG